MSPTPPAGPDAATGHAGQPLLARIPAFSTLPAKALLRMEAGALNFEPRSGTELFASGDPADGVYAVISGEGCVRMGVMDHRSKKLMVEVFRTGDIFGEISVIDGGTRTTAAAVDGRVRLMRIGASTFLEVLNDTPALGASLARMLSGRLRRTFALFRDATFETLDVRLARQVLYLAAVQGRRTDAGITLATRLKQPDLADLLGATTRSIITILNAWRADGLVRYDADRAQLTICDQARLQALATTE